MVAQAGIQYGLDWTCLRAPWIMEKDDFRHTLSFGDDVFGAPDWKTLVAPEVAARCPRRRRGAAAARRRRRAAQAQLRPRRRPRRRDPDRARPPGRRASGSTTSRWTSRSTTARSPPTSPRPAACPSIDIPSRFHSTWLDNARARLELGWRPAYDLAAPGRGRLELPARRRRPAPDLVPGLRAHTLSTPPRPGPKRRCACAAWVRRGRDPPPTDLRYTGAPTCYRSPAAGHPAGHGSRPPI